MKINSKLFLFVLSIISFSKFSFGQAAMVKVTIEHNTEELSALEYFVFFLIALAILFLIYLELKKISKKK